MKGLLARVRELPKEEEKPYIPPPFSEEERKWIHKWLHEAIPPPVSKAGKVSLAREIPLQLRDDLKTPGKKKRNRLDENSLSTNSLVSMNIKSLECSSRFPVVTKFDSTSEDPEAKVAYMTVLQSIIVREDNLINVTRLMEFTDDLYWRYTLLRLRDRKRHENKEELSKMKKKMFLKQEEIAVALAHLRGAAVELLRSVIAYRRLLSKLNKVENSNVSIMYQGENYLLKMKNDCEVFSDTLVCRLWIGFKPNTFMIPPDNHDTRALASEREMHFDKWVKQHTVYRREQLIKAQMEAQQSAVDDGGDDDNDNDNDNDNDAAGGKEDNKVQQEQKESQESQEKDIEGVKRGEKEVVQLEIESEAFQDSDDIEVRRCQQYFNRSWQQRAQSNANEDSFWEEYHHDRVLCRAIAGYPDLFPKIDLVPKLPANLQSTCMSLSDIINQETDIHEKLGKLEASSATLRDMRNDFTSTNSIDAILNGDRDEEILFNQSMLKFRQETSKGAVYNSAAQLINAQEILGPTSPNVFITNAYASQRSLSSPEKSGVMTYDEGDSLRVDNLRMEEIIIDKVESSRTFARRHQRTGELLLIENNRRCNRGKPPRMTHLQAIVLIQHVARGFLRLQKFRRRRAQDRFDHAIMLVQRVIRGWMGRKMMRMHVALFRMKACIVRKYILRKQLAAEKITKFIRRAAYISRKTLALVALKKVSMVSRSVRYRHYKEYSKLFDSSTNMIQKVWRGVLGRKKSKRFFRLRKKQIAQDQATDAKLKRLTNVITIKDDDEGNLLAKLTKQRRPGTGDSFSMGSRGGSRMGSRGGSRVGSRGGSRAETPSSRPSTRPTTPDMDVLRALDDLDLMQQQKASEQRMGRAVNSLNMKTSIRHSLLLPINGNTKGKLLCGKKLDILENVRPVDENNKSQKVNNAITWRDFYRPPGTKPKPDETILQSSQSTMSLPTLPSTHKDPLSGMSNFLRSTLETDKDSRSSIRKTTTSNRKSKSIKVVSMQQEDLAEFCTE